MTETTTITVAYGDGVGPEIMDAVLLILKEAHADIKIESIEVGERIYERGFTSGISPESWKTILKNKVFLKAPITTPQGGGYKSLNVTIRKALGLYANIRPSKALSPYVKTFHPELDIVVVRENEEDLYAGVEYRQTRNMYKSLKIFTRTGCEKIVRFAFNYAVKNNRKKVTCFTKDNIMKFTDGLFHQVFNEIAAEYPQIANEHYIVDIGMAKAANNPGLFDVIVTSNLYGDILSDIIAETCGSVGLAGSANIGNDYAMFEAIHGSAPKLAGQDRANPSGLLNAAVMMLVHINQPDVASLIENAWLKTIEDGIHTKDVYQPKLSSKEVGTKEFAEAIIERLGKKPTKLTPIEYGHEEQIINIAPKIPTKEVKKLVGVDVYIDLLTDSSESIAETINNLADGELRLQLISCKGLKVWPKGEEYSMPKMESDFWRLRFVPNNGEKVTTHAEIIYLLNKMKEASLDFIKIVNLYTFDDKLGFSLAQGQ